MGGTYRFCIAYLSLGTYAAASGSREGEQSKNYPGKQSGLFYTNSAAEQWRSSFSAVRIPNKMMGSALTQLAGVG